MTTYEELKRQANGTSTEEYSDAQEPSTYEALKNRAKREKFEEDVRNVDESYIDMFNTGSKYFFGNAEDAYDKMDWGNSSRANRDVKNAWEDMEYRRKVLNRWLELNKDSFEADDYRSFKEGLDSFGKSALSIVDTFDQARKHYSQWGSQDEYDTALRYYGYQQKYQGNSYSHLNSILSNLPDGEEKEWLAQYAPTVKTKNDYNWEIWSIDVQLGKLNQELKELENAELYSSDYANLNAANRVGDLRSQIEALKAQKWNLKNEREYRYLGENADWAEMSQAAHDEATAGFGIGIGTGWLGKGDPVYDYINFLDGSKEAHMADDAISGGSPYGIYDYMTDEERASYNYLYNTEGKEAASEYLGYLEYTLNQRRMGVAQENFAKMADEMPGFASVISVPANLLGGIGAIDVAGQKMVKGIKEAVTGEYAGPVDYNRETMAPTIFTTTTRGTVAQNIADRTGTIQLDTQKHPVLSKFLNGKSLGDVYQLGMSMVDSAAVAALSPYIGSAGTYLLGGSAASQGILDAVANGATDEQALTMGILNGAFELLFEKYELEHLLGADTNKLKAFLNQAFAESFGEAGTTTFNTIADFVVMGDNSSIMRNVAAYMENGLNQEEAMRQALLDAAIQVGWDAVGGLLTGSIMGGGASITHNVGLKNANAKAIYGADPGALVTEALDIAPDNRFAQRMQGRLDAGKDLSGGQLNRLVQQNEKALRSQDMTAIQDAASQRLTELGETGDVETIAAALAKEASGKKLSKVERQAIDSSRYGKRVSNELNVENIQSGEYSSAWAENIGTERINPQEYSRLIEAAQQPQETAETTKAKVTPQVQNAVQPAKEAVAEKETATVPEKKTVLQQPEPIVEKGQQTAQEAPKKQEAPAAQEAKAVRLEDVSKKYGAQAVAMVRTYQAGQDVEKFDKAYQAAYDMGRSGVAFDYVKSSESTSYLTDSQKELAHAAGRDASDTEAKEHDARNKAAANGKTGRRKGTVKGEGVSIADLKQTFNDTQGKAYKYLSTVAEVTGVDIVLYRSEAGADGKFQGAQGRYSRSEPGTLYIDLNAGLSDIKNADDLAKYAMLRTFAHEFTHFIENWNPIQYNELRKVVFDTLTQRGENVQDLIEDKQARNPGMSYDKASREVVAEAMTDILPDANFVQELADNHKTIFQKLLDKLKEFVQNLREYFDSIGHNRSREANALKEQVGDTIKYLDSIVEIFGKAAVQAVENYQLTVAVDETTGETAVIEEKTESVVEETTAEVEDTTPAVAENVPVEQPAEAKQPVTETDAHGFTISDNVERGSLEITFDGKPPKAVLDALKENKFRWNGKKRLWYGYADRETITDALHAAYGPEQSDFEKAFWDATQEERDEVVEAISQNTKISHIAPTEIRESADAANKEEVISNVESENGPDTPAVHEPVRGSEGPARLLEGVEPEAVQGSDEGRQPVQTGSDQGTGDAGRDRRADAAGPVPERGAGDRLGGDLQQLPAVTEAAADTNVGDKSAEDTNVPSSDPVKLHETVAEMTAQRSTENPKGSNFVIGDSLNLPGGTKARTRANIEAIKLVKQIAAEGRIATSAEQEVLSKYVGWGGLADAFGKPYSNRETRKIEYQPVEGLEAEFEELKKVLTEEEYKSARESTKNAHYTSIEVIKAMYDGLKQLGFNGGRMLEPSSGVGNFVGAMPADMTAQVKSWTMVELDNITGLFAKYLYPNADVRIQGFEQANIPDGYMDVAIGNVPFGNYAITDKHYPKAVTSAIHNYFFAKALDKVRTGGIVMFITSSYTMNSSDNAVRRYIMQRADLLGAIRLPDSAFKGNAGTDVVTDILILKKRADKTAYAGEDFQEAPYTRPIQGNWSGAYINDYFNNHPEMVLGTPSFTSGMYRGDNLTYKALEGKGSLADQIREAFKNIQGKMDYSAQPSAEKSNFRQASERKKNQRLQVKDGVIHSRDESGNLTRVDVDKDTADRITGMVAIRDAHAALCDALQQGVNKRESNSLRKALNKAYDSFVEKYGYLNSNKNRKAINAFADRYAILSLENYSTEGRKVVATKSDIFTKDTIAANRTAASAENVEEGLTISLNTAGRVDVDMIARLTGQKADSVTRQLIDQRLVFKDKNGNLIPAAQYLSGNVRAKLREMEGLTGIDSDYNHNVEALREVVPETVQHTDIYVNPGATWVPVDVYEDFVGYILKRSNHTDYRSGKKYFSVEYVPETNEYKVSINDAYAKMSAQNTQVWGEGGKAFSTIFENMLNGRRTNVYKDGGDGTRVLDKAKTEAVAEKVEKLNEEFRKWLWEDETRRAEIQELYNETFNALVTPKYSGESLTVNGLNATYQLRPHQKDAVARIINSGGNTLLAHRVGAGKTMEMAAAAMKLKQLGVIKKPMFMVPNNVVAQWGKEFKDYFPAANILVVGDEDMTPAERMTTINRIKNNDYDAVILAYTKFEKIQMTAAWRQRFYEEQIDSIMFAINAEKESQGGKGFSVKQLETKRKQLEAKLKKLTDKAKDEDGAMFEDLGVDALFVDEAHNFKNLEYSTRMNNVSGLGKADGAQRSFDLYTKVRYLQQLNGGRGVVFATATPVMNSMTEMYIMQKYLQPDTLKQLGIEHFDSWAKMFGEVVNALEIAPSGSGYRLKQTFSKFKNVKALQQLFRSFTDVLTDVPGLKIPKMKGRKVHIVECEQSEFQKNYMAELAERAENVKNVDPTEDNMLKITSDGRKISYSQRMIDPSLPYEETGKIYRCCDNVYAVYQESSKTKGTQMIFCDMATPKGKSSSKADTETNTDEFAAVDMESAQLYDDMKSRLIQLGIPAKEIAFIHDAKNDKQKAELSEKMNNGTIRVLIGSTGKMGVGLNAQKKAVAIHHLDAPWRPGDIEQRDGRVFRQKNENEEAYKFVYVTRGSFDSRLWDILERKQKFINQVMNGEDVGNEIEDTGEVTLSAAEVKAVASDNPLIMEQVALEKEISKLQSLQQAHRAGVSRAQERIAQDRRNIALLEGLISNVLEDIKNRKDTYSSDKVFSIKLGTQTFTDKKDAGTALVAAAEAQAKEGEYTDIGKFAGFDLRVVKTKEGVKGVVAGAGTYDFKVYPLNTTYGINHLISVVEGLEERLAVWRKNLSEAKSDLETQLQLAAEPFAQADKLKEKRARYNEVMDILNPPKEEQNLDSDGGDDVQYQQREYLEDGDIRDDIYYPKTKRDAEAFLRSYANKTSGMRDGETRNVLVFTENHVYFVKATGYLKGDIENVFFILGNEQLIKDAWREFDNGSDRSGEAVSSWLEDYWSGPGRRSGDTAGTERSRAAGENAGLDGREPGDSNGLGSYRDNYGYPSWEDLIEAVKAGAMVMDENGDVLSFEQLQQRTDTLTDREVLSLAADQVKVSDLTAAEKDALDIFQKRLSRLEELQNERAEQGRLYKEQQFGAKVDRAKAAQTLDQMHALDEQIRKASAEVLSVEDKTVLKRVLQKARKVVEQQEREHGQEILKRWRDRRNNAEAIKKYRDRIRGDVDELTNWILHPDNKTTVKHIPDALKNTVIPFLSSINFMSKRQLNGGNATAADKAFMDQIRRLESVMENTADIDEMYSNYNDLPPDFMKNLRNFVNTAQQIVDNNSGEFVINQMTSQELHELSKVVRTLKKYIMQMNRFHVNAMFKHVYDAGEDSISFMARLNPAENTGAVSQFLLWQQMRPAYAFERFGEGGVAIYDGLRRGQATLAFNTKKIQEFAEKAYSTAEVKAWENQVKTIRLDANRTVTMRVSQIMSLYELSKREQAKGHIFGEGIRVATFTNGKQKISDVGQTITPEDLDKILSALTPRQKEVADKLQQFMQKQGGDWGNHVTVARFGEKQFGEENYFPINSDGRHLSVDADEKPGAAALYALLNMGFTKQTQEKAKNRIIVYSIFDVFANHMASMAQYNAFALPVVDALKWFNYQRIAVDEDGTKTFLGSVREQMDRAFGVPEETRPGSGKRGYAQNFVINIIKAFNGTEAQGTAYDSFGLKALHSYNRAQVAYNFRVVVQQPLAITRAALLLDYASIIKGMKLSPAAIQKNIQEMRRYSGIAAWKSLGFYDVNISRGLTSLIKHDDTAADKITEVGMWGAEKADTLTWAGIWSACKEEVIRKQKLKPKSEGFYEAVTKLFEDVIYKTQVVDSVLTKNEFMRDKGYFARAVGSFMSEPTTTASMLVDAYDKFQMDMQRGMTRQQAWKKNRDRIVRTAYVYGLGALILAAVQAVADGLRDDDDYQTFLEKWLEAFGGNFVDEIMPFNKLPIVSDVYDLVKELLSIFGVDTYGNPPQSIFMQWYDSLVKGVEIIHGKITGNEDRYTWYGGAYKLLQALSGLTGLPMASATREIITGWNNIVGALAPSLKVKTYDSGEKNEIRYAYEDGYLTDEEATALLLEKGLVDTEDEAYWTIQGWEAGDGYSRYGAIYDAVRNGGSIDEAMDELVAHGYTEKEVLSQVKGKIAEWYKGGEITKQQATEMLSKHFDLDSDEIADTVNKWSCKVVTGIEYDDIKEEYLNGNITYQRAIDMRVRYGGYTKEEATKDVDKWRTETEIGIPYSELDDAYEKGEITASDLVNAYVTYGHNEDYIKLQETYNTLARPAGMSANMFYSTYFTLNDIEGERDENGEFIEKNGTQKARWAYIDSLDLTTEQKDALHCAFYKETTLKNTPWH